MSSTTKSARSVTFSDAVDYVAVVPYSVVYGWAPHTKVATSDGWKSVSAHACHWTGKLSDVIKLRLKQRVYDKHAINTFRQTMLRTVNACLYGEPALLTPQTVASFIATHESTVTGFKPQLIAHPSLCLSMVKPSTQSTSCRQQSTSCAERQRRPSRTSHPDNRVTCPEARRHGGAPRPSIPPSNDPSVRDCYGNGYKSDLPTPTYADVA